MKQLAALLAALTIALGVLTSITINQKNQIIDLRTQSSSNYELIQHLAGLHGLQVTVPKKPNQNLIKKELR